MAVTKSTIHRPIYKYLFSTIFTYPDLANGIVLTKASGVWAPCPTPTEIIPAGTISDRFTLRYVNIYDISANGEYILKIYKGVQFFEELLGSFSLERNAVMSQETTREIGSIGLDANTRISAAISSSNALQNTIRLKLEGCTC